MKKFAMILIMLMMIFTATAEGITTDNAIKTASAHIDAPYVFGTSGAKTFDCSGLIRFCYPEYEFPHSAKQIGYDESYERIDSINLLQRGDLVFFDTVKDEDLCDHVGIYLGNNRFIHASSGKGCVTISEFTNFYTRKFSWARRIDTEQRIKKINKNFTQTYVA